MKNKIKMYGTTTCVDCKRSREFLDRRGISYDFIDIATVVDAAEEVERLTGMKKTPTIIFPNGEILIEPTNEELEKQL